MYVCVCVFIFLFYTVSYIHLGGKEKKGSVKTLHITRIGARKCKYFFPSSAKRTDNRRVYKQTLIYMIFRYLYKSALGEILKKITATIKYYTIFYNSKILQNK